MKYAVCAAYAVFGPALMGAAGGLWYVAYWEPPEAQGHTALAGLGFSLVGVVCAFFGGCTVILALDQAMAFAREKPAK